MTLVRLETLTEGVVFINPAHVLLVEQLPGYECRLEELKTALREHKPIPDRFACFSRIVIVNNKYRYHYDVRLPVEELGALLARAEIPTPAPAVPCAPAPRFAPGDAP